MKMEHNERGLHNETHKLTQTHTNTLTHSQFPGDIFLTLNLTL